MKELGYLSCDADPDMWMKAEYRPENKEDLCFVDDILCINHKLSNLLNKLNGYMLLKPSSVRSPNMYSGTKLKQMQLHNGIWAWSMSPSKDVQEAVRICKEYFAHLRVAIALNWMCPQYWDQMRHFITSP